MRALNVTKKTGYKITDISVPVNIRDYRGILFYTTEPIMPVYEFNLPAGQYFVDSGYFKERFSPINFKQANLPFPEKIFSLPPFDFKIMFAPNPNKCSIFWKEKVIIFDDSFIDRPLPELFFIYYHECGHSKYGYNTRYSMKESEAFCDLYASNKMLELGFNPSQINKAPKDSLSDKQQYRKDFIEETLLENTGR